MLLIAFPQPDPHFFVLSPRSSAEPWCFGEKQLLARESGCGIEKALNDAEQATKRIPEVLEELRNNVAAEIKAIWEAFSQFSKRELRLGPESVVSAWFAPALAHLHEVRDTLDGVKPAPTFVDEYDASLTKTWRRLVFHDADRGSREST